MEESTDVEEPDRNEVEILIPVSNQANVEELVNLGLSLKPKRAKNGLHALTVVDDKGVPTAHRRSARNGCCNWPSRRRRRRIPVCRNCCATT